MEKNPQAVKFSWELKFAWYLCGFFFLWHTFSLFYFKWHYKNLISYIEIKFIINNLNKYFVFNSENYCVIIPFNELDPFEDGACH